MKNKNEENDKIIINTDKSKEDVISTKVVLITSKKTKLRFMPTNVSRVLNIYVKGKTLKLYREVKGKMIQNSNVWYHTDKGYVHSSQAKIVIE